MIGKTINIRTIKWVIFEGLQYKGNGEEPNEPTLYNSLQEAREAVGSVHKIREVILSGTIDL